MCNSHTLDVRIRAWLCKKGAGHHIFCCHVQTQVISYLRCGRVLGLRTTGPAHMFPVSALFPPTCTHLCFFVFLLSFCLLVLRSSSLSSPLHLLTSSPCLPLRVISLSLFYLASLRMTLSVGVVWCSVCRPPKDANVYPTTLFSNANFKTSCEGAASRNLTLLARDVAQVWWYLGMSLIVLSVFMAFSKWTGSVGDPM